MSVYCVVNARQKLHDTTRKIFLNEPLMYSNALAHCFRLTLMADNGSDPADLTGVTATANFLRPDHNTVSITDTVTITGNVIDVVLPNACYSSVGRYKLTVDIGEGTGSSAATRTAMIVEGITERNVTDTYVDPGTIMPSINTLIQEIDDAVNSIPADYSELLDSIAQTFSDTTVYKAGDFVWHGDLADGGKLYRFTQDHAAGAWTGTDAVEAVVTDGVEGDVRYDAAQTLTETQKVMARANIGGASDAQLKAFGGLVEYGTLSTTQTAERSGITVTRNGTHATVTGTNDTTGVVRFRMYQDLSNNAGTRAGSAPTAAMNKPGGAQLKAGHTYILYGRILSGTYTPAEGSDEQWSLSVYYEGTTTLWSGTYLERTSSAVIQQKTVETDREICIWLYAPIGATFTNVEMEIWLADVTTIGSRDAAIASPELPTAKGAHSEGDMIMVGGRLLKAAANIAAGDAIRTGTGGNATETSVADQIEGLKQQIDGVLTPYSIDEGEAWGE